MQRPVPNPARVLTVDEMRNLESMRDRIARLVRSTGLRGLDAEGLVQRLLWRSFLLSGGRIPFAVPTSLDVRASVSHWRRSEARTHAREIEGGRSAPPIAHRAPYTVDDGGAVREVVARVVRTLDAETRRALSLRLDGVTLQGVAKMLGGTRSKWSRREGDFRTRVERALRASGLDRRSLTTGVLDTLREAIASPPASRLPPPASRLPPPASPPLGVRPESGNLRNKSDSAGPYV